MPLKSPAYPFLGSIILPAIYTNTCQLVDFQLVHSNQHVCDSLITPGQKRGNDKMNQAEISRGFPFGPQMTGVHIMYECSRHRSRPRSGPPDHGPAAKTRAHLPPRRTRPHQALPQSSAWSAKVHSLAKARLWCG